MLTCFRSNFLICTVFIACLLVVATRNTVTTSHVAEVILDDELPPSPVHTTSNEIPTPAGGGSDEKFCHVEYQVMKRVIGKCVKLGRSLKGCAAGNYIHPMHPECD